MKLHEAAQQALEAIDRALPHAPYHGVFDVLADCADDLRAALAEPVEFDHGVGADRFKVVRGAFWWHVLIGDSPTEHGKFRSRASAEKMAADLLREFRNGAFVQHKTALEADDGMYGARALAKAYENGWNAAKSEPVQEPVAWMDPNSGEVCRAHWLESHAPERDVDRFTCALYTAPPQRKENNNA